jgi:hypothetical protein
MTWQDALADLEAIAGTAWHMGTAVTEDAAVIRQYIKDVEAEATRQTLLARKARAERDALADNRKGE